MQELGTLCVVLRLKRDAVHLTRHGGKAMSSADSRVTLTWPRAAVKTPVNVTMAVGLPPPDRLSVQGVKSVLRDLNMCVCVCACVRACVRACVHACVRVCTPYNMSP